MCIQVWVEICTWAFKCVSSSLPLLDFGFLYALFVGINEKRFYYVFEATIIILIIT